MTNPYEPPQGHGYAGYPPPPGGFPGAPPERTTGLTVLAYFCVILGGLGILGTPLALLGGRMAREPFSRRLHEETWSGALGVWSGTSMFLKLVLTLLLVATGIGIFQMRPWARTTGMAYGIGGITLVVFSQILNFTLVQPVIQRVAAEFPDSQAAQIGAMAGAVGGIAGAFLGAILPVTMLIVMTRPDVKAKFIRD